MDKVVDRIKSKSEITWQYNVDERRFYTYDEMFAKKEDLRFPDQIFTRLHTQAKRDAVRDYRLNKYDQKKDSVNLNKLETYACEPFEDVLIKQQDIEFEDVTEEEFTDIEE